MIFRSGTISEIKFAKQAKQNLRAYERVIQEARPQYPCVRLRLGIREPAHMRERAKGGGHRRPEFASADEPAGQPASSRQFEPGVRQALRP